VLVRDSANYKLRLNWQPAPGSRQFKNSDGCVYLNCSLCYCSGYTTHLSASKRSSNGQIGSDAPPCFESHFDLAESSNASMVKLDVTCMRHMSKNDYRVLTAVEVGTCVLMVLCSRYSV
jgi:hypothetical protein